MTELTDDELHVLRGKIANFVCNVTNLPAALQLPALGQDLTPLIDGVTDVVTEWLRERAPEEGVP